MKPKYPLNLKHTDPAQVLQLQGAGERIYLLVCRGDFLLQLVEEGLNGWHASVQVSNLWERQGVLAEKLEL